MHTQRRLFTVLVASTIMGSLMIGKGLASLSQPEDEIKIEHHASIDEVQHQVANKLDNMGGLIIQAKQQANIATSFRKDDAQKAMISEGTASIAAPLPAPAPEVKPALDIPDHKLMVKAEKNIYGSLFQSAKAAGIPDKITAQLVKALSHDVDFQRDIKRGDKLVVLYEATANYKGNIVKSHRPHYVKLDLGKKDVEIFITADNKFYYKDGSSAKKSLLKTPIDGARITSGFGMRTHPILGYSKMHKGTDFGAGTGTPIYAAGDGTITELGKKGAYGNYVRIKHNGTYSTAYAHASRFAKGLKNGSKVKQGQVIAYVGSTGRSTGPHLHYEVIKNGAQVNPSKYKVNFAGKLGGKELKKFKAEQQQILAKLKDAPAEQKQIAQAVISAGSTKVAMNDIEDANLGDIQIKSKY